MKTGPPVTAQQPAQPVFDVTFIPAPGIRAFELDPETGRPIRDLNRPPPGPFDLCHRCHDRRMLHDPECRAALLVVNTVLHGQDNKVFEQGWAKCPCDEFVEKPVVM